MAAVRSGTQTTGDGLIWFWRQQGSGPHVVLIPSGEGDCEYFTPVMSQLSARFTVTTFDMPGMSRSVPVPPAAVEAVTAGSLAGQIIGLMDALDIAQATFYGCSSGAAAVLALQDEHPERTRNAIVHELPTPDARPFMAHIAGPSDASMLDRFAEHLVGDRAAWDALGADYHARVLRNLPVWSAGYSTALMGSIEAIIHHDEHLRRRPIDWSLGSYSPIGMYWTNVQVAFRAGIPMTLLPARHFPQVTVPDKLAEYIEKTTQKYL